MQDLVGLYHSYTGHESKYKLFNSKLISTSLRCNRGKTNSTHTPSSTALHYANYQSSLLLHSLLKPFPKSCLPSLPTGTFLFPLYNKQSATTIYHQPFSKHSIKFLLSIRISFNMGMILGKIGVETPKYEILQSTSNYEIRKYPSAVIAQVTYDPTTFKGDKDGGFKLLANYIGVFNTPQNAKPEKIAMTSPVITKTSEKIEMTVPVVTKNDGENNNMITMQFILPAKYTKAEEAPKPLDERVVIVEEGERKYGVVKFSGTASDKVVKEKVENLKKCLEKDGFKIIGEFELARYNPPWITLPPFKTNEVMIPIE